MLYNTYFLLIAYYSIIIHLVNSNEQSILELYSCLNELIIK